MKKFLKFFFYQNKAIKGGLREHFEEALEINQKRLSYYSKVTSGASEEISFNLMRYEKRGLWPTNLLDYISLKYHKENVPLYQLEVVSMKNVRRPEEQFPVSPICLEEVPSINIWQWRSEIIKSYKKNSFQGIKKKGTEYLHFLEKYPTYFVLTRHFLESIIRSANAGQYYQLNAPSHLKRGASFWSYFFIWITLTSWWEMYSLDKKAAPIWNKNIAFIYNDIPTVPLEIKT